MNTLLLLALLAAPGPVIVTGSNNPAASSQDMAGYDITNLDDIYDSAAQATDAVCSPIPAVSHGCVPFAGVGAANNAGGSRCDVQPSGNNQLTGVTKAGTAGDTITITAIDLDCVVTSTTITEGDGTGGTYECDGAISDAVCVANLAAVLAAAAAAGDFGVTYTAASETLVIYAVPRTSIWVGVVPSDGTNTVVAQGVDGQLLLSPGSNTLPSIAAANDTNTGFTFGSAADRIYAVLGGVVKSQWTTTYFAPALTVDMAAQYLYSSTAALDIGGACAPVGIADATGATCIAGDSYLADRMTQKVEALADGDATPDVAGANRFLTPSNTAPTVITDLDNPVAGQVVTICIGNATNPSTIADAGNFNLSAAWNPGIDDCISLLVHADNDYIEIGRSDN